MASAFGACCVLLALAVFSSAAWGQAGYVHEISGTVSVERVSAKAALVKVGDMFEADTVFRTSTDGKVILKFADGQVAAVGADSALRVGEYRYVARDVGSSSSTVELMKGEMRFVTGLIGAANREGVHVTAGNSMIGILSTGGADFTVVVNRDSEGAGAVVVALGEISARTPYGQISKIAAGQYAPWQPGRSPPLPMPFAAAPAAIQAGVAALWATALPDNKPVAVAPAARAAAAAAEANRAQAAASADPGNARLRAAAQAATELADSTTQAASAAAQSVAATLLGTVLATLPPTAAGPAQAEVPPAAAAPQVPPMPTVTTVTPGGGGGCTGSRC